MSITNCPRCGETHHWSWEEAFDKFGFNDGDGLVMTDAVVHILAQHGFVATAVHWGCHNVTITSIETEDGTQLIPEDARVGYDDPRDYLPVRIIDLLDTEFQSTVEVMP